MKLEKVKFGKKILFQTNFQPHYFQLCIFTRFQCKRTLEAQFSEDCLLYAASNFAFELCLRASTPKRKLLALIELTKLFTTSFFFQEVKEVIIVNGIPTAESLNLSHPDEGPNLLIIDDQSMVFSNSRTALELMTVYSHHCDLR